MTHAPGRVVVLSGPTAVGKGTVMTQLRRLHPEAFLSVSATTRPARPGEVNGLHYWFLSDDEFDQLVDSGGLLEWATVHGAARYGTLRRPIEEAVTGGHTVILEIDLQGARQVKQSRGRRPRPLPAELGGARPSVAGPWHRERTAAGPPAADR